MLGVERPIFPCAQKGSNVQTRVHVGKFSFPPQPSWHGVKLGVGSCSVLFFLNKTPSQCTGNEGSLCNYLGMNLEQLRQHCRRDGIRVTGTKSVLLERLLSANQGAGLARNATAEALKRLNCADLRDLLRGHPATLTVSGNKTELVARCLANGIAAPRAAPGGGPAPTAPLPMAAAPAAPLAAAAAAPPPLDLQGQLPAPHPAVAAAAPLAAAAAARPPLDLQGQLPVPHPAVASATPLAAAAAARPPLIY